MRPSRRYIKYQDAKLESITESEGNIMHSILSVFMPLSGAHRPGLIARIQTARSLYRARRARARLDADQLRDIARTPAEAQREARRKPWDEPQNWTH